VIVAIVIVIAIAAIVLFWISRKYPKQREKPDPLFKAARLWIVILFAYFLLLLFEIRNREEARKDAKWLVIIFLVLVFWYAVVSTLRNRPIPSFRLWTEFVLPNVKKYWYAEPYAGKGHFTGMIFHKSIDVEKNPEVKKYLADLGKPIDRVDVFYGQAYFTSPFHFLAVVNKFTREDVMMARPPILTIALIQKFLGEEMVSNFSPIISQYDTQMEGMQPAQQEYKVQR
jgi:hypothetical protein